MPSLSDLAERNELYLFIKSVVQVCLSAVMYSSSNISFK